MVRTQTAQDFLKSVDAFSLAMDGPSTDGEVDAACTMRDTAINMLSEAAEDSIELMALLLRYKVNNL